MIEAGPVAKSDQVGFTEGIITITSCKAMQLPPVKKSTEIVTWNLI